MIHQSSSVEMTVQVVQVDHIPCQVEWDTLDDCHETRGVALVCLPTCTTAKSLWMEKEARWLQHALQLHHSGMSELPPLPACPDPASCLGEPDKALHALRDAPQKDEDWVRRCEKMIEEKVQAAATYALEFDGIVLKCGENFLLFPKALAVRQIITVEDAQSFSQQHHVCTEHAEKCDVLGKLRTHTVVQGETATLVSVRRCVIEALHQVTGCPQLIIHAAKDVPAPHIVTGQYALPTDASLLLRTYLAPPVPEQVQWTASLQLTPQDLRAQLGEDVDVRFTQRDGEPATLRIHQSDGRVTRSDQSESSTLESIHSEVLASNLRFPGMHVYPQTLTLHCEGRQHMMIRIEKERDAGIPRILHLASSAVEPFLASSAALVPGYTVLAPPQIAPVEFQVDGQEKTYTMTFPSSGVLAPLVARTLLDELGVKVLVTLHEKRDCPGIDITLLSDHVLHVRQQGEDPLVIRTQSPEERTKVETTSALPFWVPIPIESGPCSHKTSLVAQPGQVLTGPFLHVRGEAVQPWYVDLLRDAHFHVHTYETPHDGQRVLIAAEQSWLRGIRACLDAKFGKMEITVHEANKHTLACAKTQRPEAYWSSQGQGAPVEAQTTKMEMISKLRIEVIRRVLSPLAHVTLTGNRMQVACKFREPEAMAQLQDMLRLCQEVPEDQLQDMLNEMPASLT